MKGEGANLIHIAGREMTNQTNQGYGELSNCSLLKVSGDPLVPVTSQIDWLID